METISLAALVEAQLTAASRAPSGRGAHSVHGGHVLRQTVIALAAGRRLDDHEAPGEATLQVLRGRVRLTTAAGDWDGGPGDLVAIPPCRHGLTALDDAAVLLTVALGSGS